VLIFLGNVFPLGSRKGLKKVKVKIKKKMEHQNKKIKIDYWGNPLVPPEESVNDEQLKKLREEIISDGINKRSYSSAEESEIDSDDELVMKFVKPKNKTKNSEFDSISYSFVLSNKLSKMRSELARSEERLHYLKLENNNHCIKNEEQIKLIRQYRAEIKEHNFITKSNDHTITQLYKTTKLLQTICTVSIVLNLFTFGIHYF